jgi:N,N-dimethylformamidase
MLIGYVSDEMHVAIADALLELRREGRSIEARSRASGAVHADPEPGTWEVVLTKPGYGRKSVTLEVSAGMTPHRFRLLSDRLLGYCWPKWVRAGEPVELRVHSPEPYRASLWRYGWTKTQVADIGRFESFGPGGDRQVLPDGDFTVGGAGWNHHGRRFPPDERSFIEAPSEPGLHYVHLEGLASGAFFSFPLIVAPAASRWDMAVLVSNLDWNAYNDFGGRSNYVAAAGLPLEPVINPHQDGPFLRDTGARFWDRDDYDPISFDRPEPVNRIEREAAITDVMERIGEEHVAPASWRLLGWLEREGLAYDLYAETQLHEGALDLDRYRVLVLDQHPEYWSREMFLTLKAWVYERGGRLAYLGGNGLHCEVELTPEGVIHRNTDLSDFLPLRSYEGGPGSLVPSRMGRRVENQAVILGVSTTLTGMGTGAPYRVIDADHPIFEGTGLRPGDRFGERWLDARNPGGASGHETDKMNEHSPPGTRLLAKGTNPHDGGAELVTFQTASGGEVVSTGSISWICSLPVDEQVSRITANLLRHLLR